MAASLLNYPLLRNKMLNIRESSLNFLDQNIKKGGSNRWIFFYTVLTCNGKSNSLLEVFFPPKWKTVSSRTEEKEQVPLTFLWLVHLDFAPVSPTLKQHKTGFLCVEYMEKVSWLPGKMILLITTTNIPSEDVLPLFSEAASRSSADADILTPPIPERSQDNQTLTSFFFTISRLNSLT